MLKLNYSVSATYDIEVDYYTPLTVEVSGISPFAEKNYFRLVTEGNLLEIGLDVNTNQLMNIILVQASNARLVKQIRENSTADKQGIPVFKENLTFTNGLYDVKHSFEVLLSKESLKIQLTDVEESFFLSSGRVKLGFSQDETLVSMALLNLKNAEYTDLKDSFKL